MFAGKRRIIRIWFLFWPSPLCCDICCAIAVSEFIIDNMGLLHCLAHSSSMVTSPWEALLSGEGADCDLAWITTILEIILSMAEMYHYLPWYNHLAQFLCVNMFPIERDFRILLHGTYWFTVSSTDTDTYEKVLRQLIFNSCAIQPFLVLVLFFCIWKGTHPGQQALFMHSGHQGAGSLPLFSKTSSSSSMLV